jgi:hypothetical protein
MPLKSVGNADAGRPLPQDRYPRCRRRHILCESGEMTLQRFPALFRPASMISTGTKEPSRPVSNSSSSINTISGLFRTNVFTICESDRCDSESEA